MKFFCPTYGEPGFVRTLPAPPENSQATTPSCDSAHADDNADDPVAFTRTRLRLDPDPRQIEVLQSTARYGILNCSRQWGKSTIAAAKAVHRAFTRPNSTILVASPTERQSAEFIRKAAAMVATLGIRPRGDGDNANSLLFPNGSRIVGLPGTEGTVRGFSAISLILIDEASRVDDALYKALRPMLAMGDGDLWLLSTPCGKQGFFYDCWEHGGADWFRIAVPATECPRISARFLEAEMSAVGPIWFAQEYMGEFVDNGMSVFSRDLIEQALDDTFAPYNL
jgi:Terminase large subunit, T4likevirus-type, N-terminal